MRRLFSSMLLCRMIDQRFIKLGVRRPYAPAIGCEASRVASAIHLQPQDVAVLSAPNAMIPIARGAKLSAVVSELHQNPLAAARVRNGDFGLPLISSMAVMKSDPGLSIGIALAHKLAGQPDVVLMITDQASAGNARCQAAMAYAGHHRLPLLFVVEAPANSRRGVVQHDDSTGLLDGFPRIPVVGYDAVAIYRVTLEAVDHARKGYGPTLIECQAWPAPISNRTSGSPASPDSAKRSTDPLQHMELYLRKHAAWDDRWQQRLVEAYQREIEEAFAQIAR